MLHEFSINYLQKCKKRKTVVCKSPVVRRKALVLQPKSMLLTAQHELRVISNSLQTSNILQTSNKISNKENIV